MAILNCKMCGGSLLPLPDSNIAVCEYCGARQTAPIAGGEKKAYVV